MSPHQVGIVVTVACAAAQSHRIAGWHGAVHRSLRAAKRPLLLRLPGLDARAAAIVMRTVRNTVNTGRTVVCTIHQPSIDIFEVRPRGPPAPASSQASSPRVAWCGQLFFAPRPFPLCVVQSFDELLLLKRGGRVIFFGSLGDRSQDLVDYLQVCGTSGLRDSHAFRQQF
jgi:hypothetical protein